MAGMIDSYEAAVLNHITGGGGGTIDPTNWFVALFTTTPAEAGTGGVEVTGGSYARVSMANTDWGVAVEGNPSTVSNSTAVTFPTATAAWGTVLSFGLFIVSTAGTPQIWGVLDASKVVDNGDTVSFTAGDLTLQLGDPGDVY